MSFGRNLQYLRRLNRTMTQESLAERLNVSRQTVSKWETDEAVPEMDKAIALCGIFSVSLDNLFRDELDACDGQYSNLRVEEVPPLRCVRYAVISQDPESDAIGHVRSIAREYGVEKPRVIGWDFPCVSTEQSNVHGMHGYEAAWVLPEGMTVEGCRVHEQGAHRYAAIHVENPFTSPFSVIPRAYRTLMDYMRVNGLTHCERDVLPCFETDGDSMDIYIACE